MLDRQSKGSRKNLAYKATDQVLIIILEQHFGRSDHGVEDFAI